jgi:hypothetical protein
MDRRRIELQIRAIVVPFRIERRRRDSPTMEEFRARAPILDGIEDEAGRYPELEALLIGARRELESGEEINRSPRPELQERSP